MFKLASPDQTYDCPVTIQVPQADGTHAPVTYTATFKLIPDEFVKENDDNTILEKALVGWKEISDHNGKPLTFSKKHLDRLCNLVYWRRGTVLRYIDFATGLPVKN